MKRTRSISLSMLSNEQGRRAGGPSSRSRSMDKRAAKLKLWQNCQGFSACVSTSVHMCARKCVFAV